MTATSESTIELRRELRELQLMVGGLAYRIGGREHWRERLTDAMLSYRWREEPCLCKAIKPSGGRDAIDAFFADRDVYIVTLIDITFVTRDEIAAINGVGPLTMEALDAAMTEHGLTYAAEAETVGAA